MREKYKVSIVIPVYNIKNYIDRCLTSIISQTYSNIQIIIIDDGSIDGSSEICDKYSVLDDRIEVVHIENGGVGNARNIGIEKANGEYILFIDGDDYIENSYIETLINSIIENKSDLAIVDYYLQIGNKRFSNSINTNEKILFDNKSALDNILNEDLYLGYLWNKLFKLKIIKDNNIRFDRRIRIWEDLLFCIEYIDCIKNVVYTRTPLYTYIQRDNSAVSAKNSTSDYTKLYAMDKAYCIAFKYKGEFLEKIQDMYANTYISVYYEQISQMGSFDKTFYLEYKNKMKKIHGNLTNKHKIMYIASIMAPRIVYSFVKYYKQNRC